MAPVFNIFDMIKAQPVTFEYNEIEFNPMVPFKPKLSLTVVTPRWRHLDAFYRRARPWLSEYVGVEREDWFIQEGNRRFWFKDKSHAMLFKMTFTGFDSFGEDDASVY